MANAIATGWEETCALPLTYSLVRAMVVYSLFAEIASARGMRIVPVDLAIAEVPRGVAHTLHTIASGLPLGHVTPEQFGAAHECLSGYRLEGRRMTATNDRRKTGVHFTPRALTQPIVATTLRPLLAVVPPDRTLELRVCDPSVGAGAFLVELVRQLGERVLAAGLTQDIHSAKRLVAIHCAYGVDKCPFAIDAAKKALTLECRADRMPVGWLDDNLRVGDALVGLHPGQLQAFHWREGPAAHEALAALLREAIERGAEARGHRIRDLSSLALGVP